MNTLDHSVAHVWMRSTIDMCGALLCSVAAFTAAACWAAATVAAWCKAAPAAALCACTASAVSLTVIRASLPPSLAS